MKKLRHCRPMYSGLFFTDSQCRTFKDQASKLQGPVANITTLYLHESLLLCSKTLQCCTL